MSPNPAIAQGQSLIGYPVGCSSQKHHAEWHLYFSSGERKASSPQFLLQVHLSYFGVRHKEISFQWEENTKMHPKSHRWLGIHVRTLKSACSSSSSVPGPGEVWRVRGPTSPPRKRGWALQGVAHPTRPHELELPLFLGSKAVQEAGSMSCLGELNPFLQQDIRV